MKETVHRWLAVVFLGIVGVSVESGAQARETRGWTSKGKTIEGVLVQSDGETVTLQLKGGKPWKMSVADLSGADQAYLAELSARGQTIAVGRMPDENSALDRYRDEVGAYNARVKLYNWQAAAGTPADRRVVVGPIPTEPTPPKELDVPAMLRANKGESLPVDLSVKVAGFARPALVRGRNLDAQAEQIRTAYAGIGITIEMLPKGAGWMPRAPAPLIVPRRSGP